ncbi:MAG: hypothetical protein AAFQ88_01470 [Pseudomonadota bacterium]
MRDLTLFEMIVQPSVERISLSDIQFREVVDGRPVIISNVIHRNVFTDFDIKLSRHLAAVRGGGFPSITVTQRMRDDDPTAPWSEERAQHFLTVPHALRAIARRALKEEETAELWFVDTDGPMESAEPNGPARTVERSEIKTFGAALDFCRGLGAFEFLDVSGDFDMLLVSPIGTGLDPITIDLYRGSVAVPAMRGGRGSDRFEGALYELRRNAHNNSTARSYFASARHAMTAAKEEAVLAFRSAAEDKIHDFNRALGDRALLGHRLDAVMALVARLRTGLGDTLEGISEDARITALDWAEAVEKGGDEAKEQARAYASRRRASAARAHRGADDVEPVGPRGELFSWRSAS